MTAISRSACAPYALRHILKTDYDGAVAAIRKEGGDYRATTMDVLHRVLYGARHVKEVIAPGTLFTRWRKRVQGEWFVVTAIPGRSSSHAIVLKNGKALDNGWTIFSGEMNKLVVCAAWKL